MSFSMSWKSGILCLLWIALMALSGVAVTVMPVGAATPTTASLSPITITNRSAGSATLNLQSSGATSVTGSFTLLVTSTGATCGNGAQIKAGNNLAVTTKTPTAAPYKGSLPLTANSTGGFSGSYTVRNLAPETDYTVCYTAESPTTSTPQATPATTTFSTYPIAKFNNPVLNAVGGAGFSSMSVDNTSLAIAPDGTPYVAYIVNPN